MTGVNGPEISGNEVKEVARGQMIYSFMDYSQTLDFT